MPAETLKASVIIPAKNGGALLIEVVRQVLAQRTPWPFEVLVIDSGSKDGSLEQLRALDVRLYEIPPAEFGHGKTRNLGASLTHGEFIVFLTHDALPTDEHWLAELVTAADSNTDVAGAFGRHIAYPDASPALARELIEHFRGFGEQANVVRMDDSQRYRDDQVYRQVLHFFSSNNACLRRAVWQQIPLPEVEFAEDQLWAKAIIEAGYAKAYAPNACVFHSHSFGIIETYRRAFDESQALQKLFGYRLVPTLKHYVKHWLLITRRDLSWIRHARPSATLNRLTRWRWLWRTPWLNLARLGGYYLGGKQNRLPDWLNEAISRDKALQKS